MSHEIIAVLVDGVIEGDVILYNDEYHEILEIDRAEQTMVLDNVHGVIVEALNRER